MVRLEADATKAGSAYWSVAINYPGLVAGDPADGASPYAWLRDLLGDIANVMGRMGSPDLDNAADAVRFNVDLVGLLKFQRILLKGAEDLLDLGKTLAVKKGTPPVDFANADLEWRARRLKPRGKGKGN